MIRKIVNNQAQTRMPIVGHRKSGLNSGGVAKVAAKAIINPNQRKPAGTS